MKIFKIVIVLFSVLLFNACSTLKIAGLVVSAPVLIPILMIEGYSIEKKMKLKCVKDKNLTKPWMNYLAEQITNNGIPKTIEKSNYVPYELNCKKAHRNYKGNKLSIFQQDCYFDNNKTDNRLYRIQVNYQPSSNDNYILFRVRVLDRSTKGGYFFTIMQYEFSYDKISKKWIVDEGICPTRSWGR